MHALSIQQPWAWLITQGYKDIENRNWYTTYTGPLLIHAGRTLDIASLAWIAATYPDVVLPDVVRLPRGGIVGVCQLVDCVQQSGSRWFVGPYGFVLQDAHPFPFHPLRGHLGIFHVSEVPGFAVSGEPGTVFAAPAPAGDRS